LVEPVVASALARSEDVEGASSPLEGYEDVELGILKVGAGENSLGLGKGLMND
jgi:hypothetical protein